LLRIATANFKLKIGSLTFTIFNFQFNIRRMLLSALGSSRYNKLARRFVMPRLLAVRETPWRAPGSSTGGLALATAKWMVDGVHHHATDPRSHTHPACPAGLADADILVIQIPYLADSRHALGTYHSYFPGVEPQRGIFTFPRQELHRCARAPRKLTT
jgi:hypothetical protein